MYLKVNNLLFLVFHYERVLPSHLDLWLTGPCQSQWKLTTRNQVVQEEMAGKLSAEFTIPSKHHLALQSSARFTVF